MSLTHGKDRAKGSEEGFSDLYLVAGLGNPGTKYRNTRHNVGFEAIHLWCNALGVELRSRRFLSRSARIRFEGKEVILLCPQTYMNESGRAVSACAGFYGLETSSILIVHDDLDLPVGRIRVARSGSGGGHKGVLSIIHHLGTRGFARVRIGVGRPRYDEPVEEYVLRSFYEEQRRIIEGVLPLAVRACELAVSEGVDVAMGSVNGQDLTAS